MADEVKLNISIDDNGGSQPADPTPTPTPSAASPKAARESGSKSAYRRNSAEELSAKEAAKTLELKKRAEIEVWRAQQLAAETKKANNEQRAFDDDQTRNRLRAIRARLGGQRKNIRTKTEGQIALETLKQEGRIALKDRTEALADKKRQQVLDDRAARQQEKSKVSRFNFIKSAAQFAFNPTAASARTVGANAAQFVMNKGAGGGGPTGPFMAGLSRAVTALAPYTTAIIGATAAIGVFALGVFAVAKLANKLADDFGVFSGALMRQRANNMREDIANRQGNASRVGSTLAVNAARQQTQTNIARDIATDLYQTFGPLVNVILSLLSAIFAVISVVTRLIATVFGWLGPLLNGIASLINSGVRLLRKLAFLASKDEEPNEHGHLQQLLNTVRMGRGN